MGLDDFKENQEVKTVDASKKLRVGIIGCGWIAGSHIKSYLHQPDVEIVAGQGKGVLREIRRGRRQDRLCFP